MRDLFSEYYQPSNEDFSRLWREATFVFDTNVLLNLYRYTSRTRDDLLDILGQLQERIWLPHHVGLEFSRRRESVVFEQNQIFELVNTYDDFVEEKFNKAIVQKYGKRGHFFADLEKIRFIFDQTRQALRDELERARKQQPDPMLHDPIIERIDNIVRGKIGQPYSSEEMAQLAVEFEERYKQNIPPGFKDETKRQIQPDDDPANPGNKYGDVIIWYQIIDHAKQEKHPIIFVVDDVKEDWWQIVHGKKRGPRIELRLEMRQKANVQFYTYTADTFLQRARDFLQLQAQQETIEEIRESRKEEERQAVLLAGRYQGPLLYPSPTLYPSSVLYPGSIVPSKETIQQVHDIERTIHALGGISKIQEQSRMYNQLLETIRRYNMIRWHNPTGAIISDGNQSEEYPELDDETRQDQEGLPPDDASDNS